MPFPFIIPDVPTDTWALGASTRTWMAPICVSVSALLLPTNYHDMKIYTTTDEQLLLQLQRRDQARCWRLQAYIAGRWWPL